MAKHIIIRLSILSIAVAGILLCYFMFEHDKEITANLEEMQTSYLTIINYFSATIFAISLCKILILVEGIFLHIDNKRGKRNFNFIFVVILLNFSLVLIYLFDLIINSVIPGFRFSIQWW